MITIDKALAAYKHSLASYQSLIGKQDLLHHYHMKLLDVLDLICAGDSTAAAAELAQMAMMVARRLTINMVEVSACTNQPSAHNDLAVALMAQVQLVDSTPELCPLLGRLMLIRAIRTAAKSLSPGCHDIGEGL
jgi:hypothetical protein